MSEKKYLDEDGLLYVKQKMDNKFVAKENGKGLSSNDYTTAEKNKLASMDANGEENVIETVKVNGSALTPDANKAVNVTVPTKTSDLTNDDNVVKDASYVHTDNNYTTAEKSKLASIDANGEENVIEIVKVNGSALTPDANKAVDVTVPTKTSDLTNDDNVVKDASYTHTDNNYTTTEKNKLNGIASGAEVNAINTIKVNGVSQSITSKEVDITVPTNNNQLTNGAGYQTASDVSDAIDAKISSTYKAKGSVAFANLPSTVKANEGNVYNVTDAFTTTSDFVEGAGKKHPAGTNVVIVNTSGTTYKYDVLAGFIDLDDYVEESELVAITNAEIDTIFA